MQGIESTKSQTFVNEAAVRNAALDAANQVIERRQNSAVLSNDGQEIDTYVGTVGQRSQGTNLLTASEDDLLLAHTPTQILASLNEGVWPKNAVIGARYRGDLETLHRDINGEFRMGPEGLKELSRNLTFTSVNGQRLGAHSWGLLSHKFYLVKSAADNIYIFHEPEPKTRVARTDAHDWAKKLQEGDEPKFLPALPATASEDGVLESKPHADNKSDLRPSTRCPWIMIDATGPAKAV